MGTEEDKTNNGVVITIFVIGSAAMLGGSAAIVGMTRTEMQAQSEQLSAYADLETVRELKEEQRKMLREVKLPIDRAENQLLDDLGRDPYLASWATPKSSASVEATAGAAGEAGTGGAEASPEGAGGGATEGEAPEGSEAAGGAAGDVVPGEGDSLGGAREGVETEGNGPRESGGPAPSGNKPQPDGKGAPLSPSATPKSGAVPPKPVPAEAPEAP